MSYFSLHLDCAECSYDGCLYLPRDLISAVCTSSGSKVDRLTNGMTLRISLHVGEARSVVTFFCLLVTFGVFGGFG